jgi:hypothetical protein
VHEKNIHVSRSVRPRLRRIIDWLPEAGNTCHARNTVHQRTRAISSQSVLAKLRATFHLKCGRVFDRLKAIDSWIFSGLG